MIQLILIFIIFIIVCEFSNVVVLGWYISDRSLLKIVEKAYKEGTRFNLHTNRIVYLGRLPFISMTTLSPTSKYYIDGVGMVPRWTKMHKIIKQAYKDNLEK